MYARSQSLSIAGSPRCRRSRSSGRGQRSPRRWRTGCRERPAQGRERGQNAERDEDSDLPGHLTHRIIENPSKESNALAGHPKKRIPRAAQGERRSHLALKAQNLVPCPQCRAPSPPMASHCAMSHRRSTPRRARRGLSPVAHSACDTPGCAWGSCIADKARDSAPSGPDDCGARPERRAGCASWDDLPKRCSP